MEEKGLEFVLDLVVRIPIREEFADNLEHPDPVPLRLLPRGEAGALGPYDSNGEFGCALRRGGKEPRRQQSQLNLSERLTGRHLDDGRKGKA
nr:uncharacterized protein LOC109784847 isoform X2 [Aegilops tauschii subsp. strangulata]